MVRGQVKYLKCILLTSLLRNQLDLKDNDQKVYRYQVDLLVNAIESKDEIDLSRAESAKQRAENRLINQIPEETIDVTRAKLALERANNRIRIKKGLE